MKFIISETDEALVSQSGLEAVVWQNTAWRAVWRGVYARFGGVPRIASG